MLKYRKRNRSDRAVNPNWTHASLEETALVLKLNKDKLFDPNVLLPHAELNRIVYSSVDTFVEKYRGDDMSITICTETISPAIQDVFREVYRSHYLDELKKVNRYLHRHYIRVIVLIIISISAFLLCNRLARLNPKETIITYLIANTGGFCLWEIGYTQFATRDVVDERKRILRALNAQIDFL